MIICYVSIYLIKLQIYFSFSGLNDIVGAIKLAIDTLKGTAEGTFTWAKWLAEKTADYACAMLGCVAKWLGNKFPKLGKVFNVLGIGKTPQGVQGLKDMVEDTFFSQYTRWFLAFLIISIP